MEWKAELVVLENGKIPFEIFLDGLDNETKLSIVATIDEILG